MTNELNTTLYVIYFVNHKGAFNVLCLQSYNRLSAWDHVQNVVKSVVLIICITYLALED